jgi:hypothetical protein
LRLEKFDRHIPISSVAVDGRRMDVACLLQPQLASDYFLARIRFTRNPDGNLSVAQHDSDSVEVMFVQQYGVPWLYPDRINVHEIVMKDEVMMRLQLKWDDALLLRATYQRKK